MTSQGFAILIVEQHWMPGIDEAEDLCSHGALRISIGGVSLMRDDEDWADFGISQSALQLLRTLDRDRIPGVSTTKLIHHGCGFLSIPTSCPLGIDWSVRHIGGEVVIDDVTVEPEISRPRRVDVSVRVPWVEYRGGVVAFARTAVDFVESSPKTLPTDEWDRADFERWRSESLELLARSENPGQEPTGPHVTFNDAG